MNTLPFKQILGGALMAGAMFAAPLVEAAAINDFLNPAYTNAAQDRDRDRILDSSNQVKTSGSFAVGDVFQAVLQFDSIQWLDGNAVINDTPIGNSPGLYAYSEVRITNIAPGTIEIFPGVFVPLPGYDLVTFGAANYLSTYMVDLYEGTPTVGGGDIFAASVTADDAIAAVQSMTRIASFGIGDVDDFWTALIPSSISVLAATTPATPIAPAGNFGLSMLDNPGGLALIDEAMPDALGNFHDIIGKASVENAAGQGWLVATDTKVYFKTDIPEPGSLALLGIGTLLMGGKLQRRRSA